MTVAVGADHAGYALKEEIKKLLTGRGIHIQDYGTNSSESTDYPEYAVEVGRAVSNKQAEFGILICGSGIGMSIVANKIRGIRSALCLNEEFALLSRMHNNANVATLAARFTKIDEADKIITAFLDTKFEEGGRHERRVKKIHDLTGL